MSLPPSAAGEPSCIGDAFLSGWVAFLAALQKHVKSNEPEDKALQVGWGRCGLLQPLLLLLESSRPRMQCKDGVAA